MGANEETDGQADEAVAIYRRTRSQYEAVAERLQALLADLLSAEGIETVLIECRAKSPESLELKLEDKGAQYEDPLEDVTDLIGVRVITYYLEDVVLVENVIRREFEVDEANSYDRAGLLDPDRFGYLSSHFIVRAGGSRADLAEWAGFRDKCAEIQVRTATQHAWAAVEHKLTYKSVREIPAELQRRLSRLSALFALADEQFSESKRAVDELEARYAAGVREGNLDVSLDGSSLEAYIAESETVQDIKRAIEETGLELKIADNDPRRSRDFRDLLGILFEREAETIRDVDNTFRDEAARKRFSAVMTNLLAAGKGPNSLFLEDWLGRYALIVSDASLEWLQEVFTDDFAVALRAAMDAT